MHFLTLFFDLDATLYPASNGLWEQIRLRIYKYMQDEVGIPPTKIPSTRDFYWKTYGTTLEGLRVHHGVDPEHYLDFVHDLALEDYLVPDYKLRSQLQSLPQDLWVFTNADHKHARRVLDQLKIADLFTGIVDLISMNYVVKPNPEAYQIALKKAGSPPPERCVLFDDLLANLQAAKQLGFTTSLVGENGVSEGVDYHLTSLNELKQVMPQLWKG
jgi:putative hydrolase of the HAD superfamily